MKYNNHITAAVAVLLALAVNTAPAAVLTIDLDSACAFDDSPCTIPASGIMLNEFITLSSPDGAQIVNPTTTPLDAALALFQSRMAVFEFDDSKALVTDIAFAGSGGFNGLTYTVFETDTDSTSQTETDDFTALITGYESIIRLELSAVEGSARNLIITYTPVPVPAAAWLFGSGLLGLAGIAARKPRR